MSEHRETIRAAAVIYRDAIYEGGRHQTIIIEISEKLGAKGLIVPEKRGFVTSTGRFVTRTEAAKIAADAGQTYRATDLLYSEDIAFYKE